VVLLRWIIAQRKRTELAVLQAHDELEQRVQERTAQLLNATEALQESEARWRGISELTSDWAYAYRRQADGGLLLEWVTGAFARITGFTLEEVQARGGLRALVHPDDLAGMGERDQALPEGQPVSREAKSWSARAPSSSLHPRIGNAPWITRSRHSISAASVTSSARWCERTASVYRSN